MTGYHCGSGRAVWATALLLLSAGAAPAAPHISDVTTDKAMYRPGQPVTVSVRLDNPGAQAASGTVRLGCWHLETTVAGPAPKAFLLRPGASATVTFRWTPPTADFQGYGVEAVAQDTHSHPLDRRDTAVDVSSTWTRFPRYGYVARFPDQPSAVSQDIIGQLNRYHINGVQFQDWQFKHHHPLAGTVAHPADEWRDIANRPTSRKTVLDLIAAAHADGMAALNYNLLYGAWSGYGDEGVDYHWGLWKNKNGTDQDSFPLPGGWATPTVYLFNPADPGWQRYLLDQEAQVFQAYPFDGWQVDQLGDRGTLYDFTGNPVTLWQTFRPFLNAAKATLRKTIIFNNVGGYGLYDTCANSTEDATYIECWEWSGQRTYNDLKTLIGQAANWSHGKAVILAAYMDRAYANSFSATHPGHFNPPGVLLADAVLFASGGSHIEWGDGALLADTEYFPNHNLVPTEALQTALGRYYDFDVAYENLLRGNLPDSKDAVTLSVPASPDATPNTVWAFAKTDGARHVLHLINLIGEHSNAWRDDHGDDPAPTPQANIAVTYHVGTGTVRGVRWASPDAPTLRLAPLPFTTGRDAQGHYARFTLPTLAYWDMVSINVTPAPAGRPAGAPRPSSGR